MVLDGDELKMEATKRFKYGKEKEERNEIRTLVLANVATDAIDGLKVSFKVISPKKPRERMSTLWFYKVFLCLQSRKFTRLLLHLQEV